MFKSIFEKRFNGDSIRCAYCGAHLVDADDVSHDPDFGPPNATADHIVPRSKGGLDFPSNVVPCCRKCNSEKNARSFGNEWSQTKYDESIREEYRLQLGYVAARASAIRPEQEIDFS